MDVIKLNLLALFREQSKTLEEMPAVSEELFFLIVEFLSKHLGECRIVVGDRFLSGSHINTDVHKLKSSLNINERAVKVNSFNLTLSNVSSVPYLKYDGGNNRNYVGTLPILVETESDINFVKATSKFLNVFSSSFEKLDAITLGFGETDSLINLFEKDFDCLFAISEALGITNKTDAIEVNESIQTKTADGICVIPHFPISAILAAYVNTNVNIIDKFTERLRMFRATTQVLDILEKKYVVIRGMYRWLSEDLNPLEAKLYIDNPIEEIYEETLLKKTVNTESDIEITDTKVSIADYKNAPAGSLYSIVKWSKDNGVIMVKIFYPTQHSSSKQIEIMKQDLQEKFDDVEQKMIEINDDNESSIISMFKKLNPAWIQKTRSLN